MPSNSSAFERLQILKRQAKELELSALAELKERRSALVEQLEQVNAEIAELTGAAPKAKWR